MDYIEILRDWERQVADPRIYESLDILFPSYGFRRTGAGGDKDHWYSPLKMNLGQPRHPNREKTVVYRSDFKFREQGDWDNAKGVVDMLMDTYGCSSPYEAYRYVAGRLCMEMPVNSASERRDENRRQALLEKLAEYFTWNLFNNRGAQCEAAWKYLELRGFDAERTKALGFGFVPRWETVEKYITAPRCGYTKEELDSACRVRDDAGNTTVGWKHCIAIPYRCGGYLKGFLFRAYDPEMTPKYKATTGLDRKGVFFNMPEGREPKDIIVVEGEMDALKAASMGIAGVVAMGGSEIAGDRRMQVYDAISRNTRRIVLCPDLDTDREGHPNRQKRFRAVRKTLHTIFDVAADFREVYVAELPEPCDPDEFLDRYGKERFEEVIGNAKPWWTYLAAHSELI